MGISVFGVGRVLDNKNRWLKIGEDHRKLGDLETKNPAFKWANVNITGLEMERKHVSGVKIIKE